MKVTIPEKIRNPTIIEGFPGFGLVGAIATEYLTNHLDVELVGKVWFEELQATIAIHQGKIINPLSIYYNEKYNLLLFHSITASTNMEWKIADLIIDIANQCDAKEIISLEGIGGSEPSDEPVSFHFSKNEEKNKQLESMGSKVLKEGIVIGVTSALLLKSERDIIGFFVETQSNLPDSKAAAKIIEILDKYLKLEVDYHPLLQAAEKFEEQIQDVLNQTSSASKLRDKKTMSYVG